MFNDFTPHEAALLSSLCATLLYGINVVVFFSCVYILLQRRDQGGNVAWVLMGAAVAQFLASTLHIGNSWRTVVMGFIWTANTPGGAIKFFTTNPTKPVEIIAKVLIIVNSIFADSVLIWRMYIVWGQNRVICILPMICTVVYSVVYFVGIGKLTHPVVGGDPLGFVDWLVAGLSVSLGTNIIVTGMIAGRIWWQARTTVDHVFAGSSQYMAIVWTLIESGAVYTLTAILTIAFSIEKKQVGGFLSNLFIQIAGIVPTLIIVRVGLRQHFGSRPGVSLPLKFSRQGNTQPSTAAATSVTEVENRELDVFEHKKHSLDV